jgi:hypothetical protein
MRACPSELVSEEANRTRTGSPCRARAVNGHTAAAQRDELAMLHSITSSARASSVGGTSMPSALLEVDDQLELGRLYDR